MHHRYLGYLGIVATIALGAASLGAPSRRVSAQAAPPRADAGLARLEAEMARLATIGGGTVGVAAVHLETGREAYLNRGVAFPMASSYKVPIAVQLLSRVDAREIRLDSMIAVQPGDLHPGSGTLTELFDDPGVSLSLRNLLELMLLISDNSATDMVLRTAGGPGLVTARMGTLGVRGVRVDRPTVRLIGDWIGIEGLTRDDIPPARFDSLARAVPEAMRKSASATFDRDPRDTSTPEGMVRLLEKIWRKQALSAASSEILLDIMRRCTTGPERIKGMLPPGTVVRHKTGTIGGTTNDIGIIDLPDGAGHLAIAVFVKGSDKDVTIRERAIAQISRAAYDYFAFNPGAATGATGSLR
ncbi:MAG: class A beta-lactamase [Gemmatimonadaceae bacterium]